MNTEQIKILLAQEFATQRKWSQTDTLHLSDAKVMGPIHKRAKSMIDQLEASNQEDVYEAFAHFGPHHMTDLIMHMMINSDIVGKSDGFVKACIKLSKPDLSWEEVNELAQEIPVYTKDNLDSLITSSFSGQMNEAVKAFGEGQITPAEIPYIADRSYLSAIGGARNADETCEALFKAAITYHAEKENTASQVANPSDLGPFTKAVELFEHTFQTVESAKGNLTIDQELQVAGILMLACKHLPENNWRQNHFSQTSVSDFLNLARDHVTKNADLGRFLPVVDRLIKRVTDFASKHEVFGYPAVVADRIFDHDFEQKVRACLTSAISHESKPAALEM